MSCPQHHLLDSIQSRPKTPRYSIEQQRQGTNKKRSRALYGTVIEDGDDISTGNPWLLPSLFQSQAMNHHIAHLVHEELYMYAT